MRAVALGMAAMLAGWAMPAAAQNEGQLPLWAEGTWCAEPQPKMKACTRHAFRDGKMFSTHIVTIDGEERHRSETVSAVEEGRLVRRTPGAGTAFREVSQRPGELVVENIVPENVANGDASTITYRVTGDEMTVELTFTGKPNMIQRYKREK